MRLAVLALLAFASFLPGCAVPLGGTTYPHAQLVGIEGDWTPTSLDDAASNAEEPSDVTVTIRRAEAADGATSGRYIVTLASRREPANDATAADKPPTHELPFELEGEFIRTRHWVLFTFQHRVFDFTGLSVPVQRTLRVDRITAANNNLEQLRVCRPRSELVYVPLPMAGELRFTPPPRNADDNSMHLVQNVDDIFATLDKADDADWEPIAVLTRAK